MKRWLLDCSRDGIDVDYEEIIWSESEPEFWDCYQIAEDHDCEWFTVIELEGR